MQQGFVKVAAVTPDIRVADPAFNRESVLKKVNEAAAAGANVIVCPELCLTGYTCNDLFLQELLLREAEEALGWLVEQTKGLNALIFVGLPISHNGKLYNAAAAFSGGALLGLVPKTSLPNYGEFYEQRYFSKGMKWPVPVSVAGRESWMGTRMIFRCMELPALRVSAEICEDLWAPCPPSNEHALAGATLLVNLSASDEATGKDVYRRDLIKNQSARLVQDVVFSGHNLIAENGALLAESKRFENEITYSEIDVNRMESERRRLTTLQAGRKREMNYFLMDFSLEKKETALTRFVDASPFVPRESRDREKRCEEIFAIQRSA